MTVDALINFWQQNQQRLATLACVLIVVLMMASLVQTTFFVLDNIDPASAIPDQPPQRNTASEQTSALDFSRYSLFGKVERQAPQPVVVNAPETKLNLELLGVFTAEEGENSAAIISESNNSEIYRVGDRISGNAVLDAVFDDHILIKRGPRLEKLMFSDASMRAPTPTTVNAPPNSNNAQARNLSAPNSQRTARVEEVRQRIMDRRAQRTSGGASPGSAIREFVEQNRDTLTLDPATALSQLGVEPVEQGEARGYRLDSEASNPLVAQAGLKAGDVILSVNGRPVGNAMNDAELIDQAMEQKRVRVEVQRDKRRFFLTVPIP